MRTLTILLLPFLFISQANAQISDDYIDAFNAATRLAESGDLARGYDAALGLLAIADDDEERLRAHDLAMNIAMVDGRWLDAENQAYAGAQLVRDELGGLPPLLTPFLELQAEAARQQNAMDRYYRLQAEIRSAQNGRYALIWNEERGGYRHRLTGFLCPESLYGLQLGQWHTNDGIGTDSSCMYFDPASPTHSAAVELRLFEDGVSAPDMPAVLGERATLSPVTEVPIDDFTVNYQQGPVDDRFVGHWTAHLEGWAVSLSIFDDVAMPVDGIAPAMEAFAGLEDAQRHLSRCNLSRGERRFGREEESLGISTTMVTAAFLHNPVGQLRPNSGRLDCLIARLESGRLRIAYAEVDHRGRPGRFVARSEDGQPPYLLATESTALRNFERAMMGSARSGIPFIFTQHLARSVEIYGVFNGPPSAAAFLDHVSQVDDGELEPRAGTFIDENGEQVIDISNMAND